MKKVNQDLLQKLSERKTGRVSDNTCIIADECNAGTLLVQLHGNTIAAVSMSRTGRTELFDAGWQSGTTKDRLNALLTRYAPGWGIIQKDWKWGIVWCGDWRKDWKGSATFADGSLAYDG
jgi:hypothetical protein